MPGGVVVVTFTRNIEQTGGKVQENVPQNCTKPCTKELTERQRIICGMLEADGSLSATAISEKISEKTSEKMIVTSRTIEHDLAIMKKMGVLRRIGGRKTGHWEVVNNNEA